MSRIKRGEVAVDTGYTPRPLQALIHQKMRRFNVFVCHRRFGKTVCVLNEMIDQGLRFDKKSRDGKDLRNPQYAYIAPTYGAAKRIAWEYLKDFTKMIEGAKPNEAELRIDIPRPHKGDKIRFMLLGAENPGNLRGIYLDGVILDEYAECDPSIWSAVIRPALSDRKGWAMFIGTPKGRNHFYDVYHATLGRSNWFHAIFKASETGYVEKEELEEARITMSEEEYNQEYECSFSAALVGAYYSRQLAELDRKKKLRANVPYDPALSVYTFWDLGIGDSNAIWFAQVFNSEVRLIDYEEDNGRDLDYWVKLVKEKNYDYARHVLPHDAAARSLETGKTRLESLKEKGLKDSEIQPRQAFDDGIHAVRMILPRCVFDKFECERGILCLENYQKKYDAKNKVFSNKPLHDWSSHGSDAFRYLALWLDNLTKRVKVKDLPRHCENEYNIFD